MKFIKKLLVIFGILLLILAIIYFILYLYVKKNPIDIKTNNSYYIYDKDNKLINSMSDEWIKLSNISDNLIYATISIEDKNFYKHHGFDYPRIFKSMITNITHKNIVEGASTITQQYAKNLFLDFNKTWERKIKEAWLTFKLETNYSKDEILEGYLNTINYGNVYGIENAAHYYFNKSSKDLTVAEASMLAGIPNSPNNYSPLINENKAKKRQKVVLNAMVKNKYITSKQANDAYNTKLRYYGHIIDNDSKALEYYQTAVMSELKSIKSIPKSILDTGGLKIYTYLDTEAQKTLEDNINKYITNDDIEVASIMMNPNNGGVIALIGGKDYQKSEYNRAINAKRQVGSTIKPFLYYTALENGFTASSTFKSEKTTFLFDNDKTYSPKNYNDKYGNKDISMATALSYSDNIYAVKTHLFLGEKKLVSIANRLGINGELEAVPSLALGTEEISLFDMVTSYAAFANMGNKVNGHFIKKIEDSNGKVLYEYKDEKVNILNESLVYILNEMLTYTHDTDFIDYNYPTLISLLPKMTNKYAVKSGTTNTDMWIIGYNKNAVLGVWTGYDDNREFTSLDTSHHKDIWIETMEGYLKDKKNEWYEVPNNIVGVLVNPLTGEIADTNTKRSKMFYFVKGTEPHSDYSYNLDSVFKEDQNDMDDANKNMQKNDEENNEIESNLENNNNDNS